MELPDFIEELESAIAQAGSDQLWKRRVGGRLIWFAPMTFTGQAKTNESLANPALGPNVVFESKRVTLSHAIVGIDDIDLRPWRDGPAVFPSVNKDGKKVKVPLEKYMYEKMRSWGGQYIDDVFSVYADLIETHQRENLKEIRFENAKDPRLELLELEARVAELRKQLSMPPLVEAGSPAAKASVSDEASEASEVQEGQEAEDAAPEGEAPRDPPAPEEIDFNPFKPVRNDGIPEYVQQAEARRHGRRAPDPPPPPQLQSVQRPYVPSRVPPNLEPLPRVPTDEDELFASRGASVDLVPPPGPRNIPLPPVDPSEVIEKPAERKEVEPPVIDPVQQNVNPRFARPVR